MGKKVFDFKVLVLHNEILMLVRLLKTEVISVQTMEILHDFLSANVIWLF